MQYRTYGTTGIQVSALGFGAGRFPVAKRDFDLDHIVGILRRAFDMGINYVDTAKERKWRGSRVRRWAEACVECGECEPKCPQEIPIRERLQETAEALGAK